MWFRRSDGLHFSAEKGSAEFKLMSKDGSFKEIDEPSSDETPQSENQENKQSPAPKTRRKKAEIAK